MEQELSLPRGEKIVSATTGPGIEIHVQVADRFSRYPTGIPGIRCIRVTIGIPRTNFYFLCDVLFAVVGCNASTRENDRRGYYSTSRRTASGRLVSHLVHSNLVETATNPTGIFRSARRKATEKHRDRSHRISSRISTGTESWPVFLRPPRRTDDHGLL